MWKWLPVLYFRGTATSTVLHVVSLSVVTDYWRLLGDGELKAETDWRMRIGWSKRLQAAVFRWCIVYIGLLETLAVVYRKLVICRRRFIFTHSYQWQSLMTDRYLASHSFAKSLTATISAHLWGVIIGSYATRKFHITSTYVRKYRCVTLRVR